MQYYCNGYLYARRENNRPKTHRYPHARLRSNRKSSQTMRNQRQNHRPQRLDKKKSQSRTPRPIKKHTPTQTSQTCQTCDKLKQLTEENLTLKKEIDSLKRSLIRYENPHTPSSRRMYPHKIASQVEKETKEHFANAVVTVHIEPECA